MKSMPKPKIDWSTEFMMFLNEKEIYWLYQNELRSNSCSPNEFISKMTGYNRGSYYWALLNVQWQARIKMIEEEQG